MTATLANLHVYQLSSRAPKAPAGSYDVVAFEREKMVSTKGQCATCHVPPLLTQPGHNMYVPREIGIDSFQADRAPTHLYRTALLSQDCGRIRMAASITTDASESRPT